MIRSSLAALAVFASISSANAFDIEAMSDEDRAIFRAEIRDYLLENPEVLMEAIQVLEQRQQAQAAVTDLQLIRTNFDEIFNDGHSYVGGNPEGDVTIVEFLDYRCGFCKRAFPAVKELLATDGNIRFVVKEFPILGEASMLASRYALAARVVGGDDAYIEAHDQMMAHRGEINEGYLARLSRELGVPHHEVLLEMNNPQVDAVIAKNRALAQTLQISGTPSFIMGENFVRGFIELDQMRTIVESIRAEAG